MILLINVAKNVTRRSTPAWSPSSTACREHVESGDRDFNLPYCMLKNGKIDDNNTSYSIKVQFNSEEQWTKALKFLLTNLKWIKTWISTQFENENV